RTLGKRKRKKILKAGASPTLIRAFALITWRVPFEVELEFELQPNYESRCAAHTDRPPDRTTHPRPAAPNNACTSRDPSARLDSPDRGRGERHCRKSARSKSSFAAARLRPESVAVGTAREARQAMGRRPRPGG